MIKIVTAATIIIKEHNLFVSRDDYFKTSAGGIITQRYLYKWLKTNGFSELCYKQNFKKLIEQIDFELKF